MHPVSRVTAITASVIQMVQSAFWLIIGIVLVVVAASDTSSFPDTSGLDPRAESDARGVLIGFGVLFALVAGGMITLAILALRRVNGCRIASAVVQIVFGILPLIGLVRAASSGDGGAVAFSLVFTASCAAAAVLFLRPESARYCQRNVPAPPGY